MTRIIAALLVLVMVAEAAADPRTIMVLPVDGDADAALRTGLTQAIETIARKTDGTVKAGATTFAETAAAVGCDPATPACAESVRKTLAVDELIYGTATVKDGQVSVVVRKKVKDKDPEEVTQTIAPSDPPDKVVTAVSPLLGVAPPVTCPDNATPGPDGKCPAPPPPPPPPKKAARTDRALAIASFIGAGVALVGGLTLWNDKSKKQDQIDSLPTNTAADFATLVELEDSASQDATFGNLLMIGAIGLGVAGYYFLRRDRKAQRDAAIVAPAPVPGGAGVVIRFSR